MTINGIVARSGWRCRCCKNSSPPILGIFQSLKMRSGEVVRSNSTAVAPSSASKIEYPRAHKISARVLRRFASSSTIKIVAGISRIKENDELSRDSGQRIRNGDHHARTPAHFTFNFDFSSVGANQFVRDG